jgi:hypothetical protein
MISRRIKSCLIISLLVIIPACDKPTYSKERVKESIIELCKNEYNLDVNVRITGSTLGVLIPIDGLIDPDLKLNKEAGEKIEDVALSIHRVTMSTDNPPKFYVLVARDTKSIGAEFVLAGYVYDVVRVRLFDISRGEYHKRIIRDFKFNPSVVGEAKIKELFKALNEDSVETQNIQPLFYPIYSIGKKGSQRIDISEISSKEISPQESLFYIKTKEYYVPIPEFEAYDAIFPNGFDNEYLFLINMSLPQSPLKEIVPKYFYSGTEIRQRNLQDTFDQYKDLGYIRSDGFPKKELTLDWFLSQIIARRIKMLFSEDKELAGKFSVQDTQGSIENKIFRFYVSFVPHTAPERKNNQAIFSDILKTASVTLHRYSFEDFEGIEIIDTAPDGAKLYLSKYDLERFRKNRLEIDKLI